VSLGRGFQRFPTGSNVELIVVSLIALMLLVFWLSRRLAFRSPSVRELKWDPLGKAWVGADTFISKSRLVREFREIVREPLPDPNDPRFKKWNMRERFPWG
jgi:hypothetical protein